MLTEAQDTMLICVLVFVVLIFIFQIELYRQLLTVTSYYAPEAIPPLELRVSRNSFLKPHHGKKDK